MPPLNSFEQLDKARELIDRDLPQRAISLLSKSIPKPLQGERHFLLAEAHRAQGFFLKSLHHYQYSLRLTGKHDHEVILYSLLGIIRASRSLGKTKLSWAAFNKAQAIAQKIKNRDLDQNIALERALIFRAQGQYKQALLHLNPLLNNALRDKDWSLSGFILWSIAGAKRFSGDLVGSTLDFNRALKSFKKAQDRQGQAYALFGLGVVERIQGHFNNAKRSYLKAGELLEKGSDLFGRAYAHCGLANVLRQLGDFDEAQRQYQLSYKLYASLDDQVDLAYVVWGLGQIYLKSGDFLNAEKYLTSCLKTFKWGHEIRGVVLAMLSLSQLKHACGHTKQAEQMYREAIHLSRKNGLYCHLEIFT